MLFGRKKMRNQLVPATPLAIEGGAMPAYSFADKPMEQKPSIGSRLLGSALDGLSAAFGAEPSYIQGIQRQRQAQLAEQERQRGLQDYEKKQQIEAKYRAPQINDTERDYELYTRLYGVDKAKELLARPQYVQQANGQYLQLGGFNPNESQPQQRRPEIGAEIDDPRKAGQQRNVVDQAGAAGMRAALGEQGFQNWVRKNGLTIQGGQ
jgi:hypothetical protein